MTEAKLVPVEPTREMWAAGANAVAGYKQRHHDKVVEQVWSAMLSAAPEPVSGPSKLKSALEVARIIHPDLFSYDKEVAHRSAAPMNVSYARAEALREIEKVLNAAQPLSNTQELDGEQNQEVKAISFVLAHQTAVDLGYPSLTEALEDLYRLKSAPVVGEPWGWVVSWDETPGLGRRIEMFTGPDWKAKAEERARDESTFPGVSSVEVYPVYRTAPVVGEPAAWARYKSGEVTHISFSKAKGYHPLYTSPCPKLDVAVKALEVARLSVRMSFIRDGNDPEQSAVIDEIDQALAQIKGAQS